MLHLDEIEEMQEEVTITNSTPESNWLLLWQMFIDRWDELNKLYEDNPLRLEFDYDQFYNRLNKSPTSNKWQRGYVYAFEFFVWLVVHCLFLIVSNCSDCF